MDFTEKPVKQDYIFKGKIVNLRVDDARLPDGSIAKREVVEHPGGVCVAALTDREELLFVEQFRYPYGEVVLELPAGKLEYGEDPFEAAKRELFEETGLIAERLELFGIFSGKDTHYVYPNGDEVSNVDIVYLCREYSGELICQEGETDELRFFAADELPENLSPPIRVPLLKWAETKKQK